MLVIYLHCNTLAWYCTCEVSNISRKLFWGSYSNLTVHRDIVYIVQLISVPLHRVVPSVAFHSQIQCHDCSLVFPLLKTKLFPYKLPTCLTICYLCLSKQSRKKNYFGTGMYYIASCVCSRQNYVGVQINVQYTQNSYFILCIIFMGGYCLTLSGASKINFHVVYSFFPIDTALSTLTMRQRPRPLRICWPKHPLPIHTRNLLLILSTDAVNIHKHCATKCDL